MSILHDCIVIYNKQISSFVAVVVLA